MFINAFQTILLLLLLFLCRTKRITQNFLDIEYTTNLRGIAILFVVMHHVSNSYNSNLFTPLGGIGVSMFLVLSGYGLNESYHRKGLVGFWKSKLLRVLIPCWLIEFLFLFFDSSHFDYIIFIKHLLCIDVNWYIRYLFYWYLLFYFSTKYFPTKRLPIMYMSGLCFLLILPEIEAEQSVSFLSGLVVSEFSSLKKRLCSKYLKWGRTLLLLGIIVLFLKQIPIIREFEGTILYNFIQMVLKWSISFGFIILYMFISNRRLSLRLFSCLGIISYELYLTHCKFLGLLNNGLPMLKVVAFYCISTLTAYIFFKLNKCLILSFK